jgi:hypothetical protein
MADREDVLGQIDKLLVQVELVLGAANAICEERSHFMALKEFRKLYESIELPTETDEESIKRYFETMAIVINLEAKIKLMTIQTELKNVMAIAVKKAVKAYTAGEKLDLTLKYTREGEFKWSTKWTCCNGNRIDLFD